MAWPWSKQGIRSPNLDVKPEMQQYFSGTDWRSRMQPMNVGWSNTNVPKMNALQADIAQVAKDTTQEEFDAGAGDTYEDTTKNMRLHGEPWRAENWTPKDIFDMNTTLGGYQKYPNDLQFNNKDKYLRSDEYLDRIEPSLAGQNFDQRSIRDIVSGGIINIKKGGKKFMTPLLMMANAINPLSPTSSNFNPMLEGQLQNYTDQGFRVNEQGQAIDGPLAGQNLVSGFGTNDVTQMLRDRLQKIRTRKIAQTTTSRAKQQKILDAIKAQTIAENKGYTGTPGGNVGSGVFAKVDQSGKTYGPYSGQGGNQGNQGGNWGAAVGTTGAWGPGAKKDGGRIGYQNGELVEQETDFIQGPRGDEEFQETVVEGQEQPSREQLEALSMEIFQLPLEELDDQQLLVVYQEAMQGQPMEEAVQEEDVQFAAQGGLAGLL